VLVVDDDLALRGLLAMSLESVGYQVKEAKSAEDAFNTLKLHPDIQLLVLDMGMPPHQHTAEEGLRVLDWLANQKPSCKTIVLTGQDAEETSYQAILHGAFDFLSKPVEVTVLQNALARAALFIKQNTKMKQQEGLQKLEISVPVGDGVKKVRNAAELKLLQHVLNETQFNVHETARRLGLKRENVYYLIKKYGIDRDSV